MAKNKTGNQTSKPNKERENSGRRGARRQKMDPLSLAQMGKGQVAAFKPLTCGAYLGTHIIKEAYDAKQAKLNRELGYC